MFPPQTGTINHGGAHDLGLVVLVGIWSKYFLHSLYMVFYVFGCVHQSDVEIGVFSSLFEEKISF
jgi:hypothetical protein